MPKTKVPVTDPVEAFLNKNLKARNVFYHETPKKHPEEAMAALAAHAELPVEHIGELIERYWDHWEVDGVHELTAEMILRQYAKAQPFIERRRRLRKGRQLLSRKKILPFTVMLKMRGYESFSRKDVISETRLKEAQVDHQLRHLVKTGQMKKHSRDCYSMTPEQRAAFDDLMAMMQEAKEYRSKPFYFIEHRTPEMLARLNNKTEQDYQDWKTFCFMQPKDEFGNRRPWDQKTAELFAWNHPVYNQVVWVTEEDDGMLGKVLVKKVLWEYVKPAPRPKNAYTVYREFVKKRQGKVRGAL